MIPTTSPLRRSDGDPVPRLPPAAHLVGRGSCPYRAHLSRERGHPIDHQAGAALPHPGAARHLVRGRVLGSGSHAGHRRATLGHRDRPGAAGHDQRCRLEPTVLSRRRRHRDVRVPPHPPDPDAARRLAIRDPLTLVYNARAFAERLGQELKRTRRYGRPLSVLYLDLDDFKRVNDSHGHQTGDAVLKLVADAIRRAVRQLDVVSRLGGDEFAVLMPETDGDLADAAAARLAKELRDAFKGTPAVTASVGVVSCTRAEAGVDEVLRQADQAMYQAKRKGKDQAVKVA